jgi:hypothetical protein
VIDYRSTDLEFKDFERAKKGFLAEIDGGG